MDFHNLHHDIIEALRGIAGERFVFLDEQTRRAYGHDETEDLVFPPAVVVKPASAEEVSAILKLADANRVPVTTIGGRTGLTDGEGRAPREAAPCLEALAGATACRPGFSRSRSRSSSRRSRTRDRTRPTG